MNISPDALRKETVTLLKEINAHITVVEKEAMLLNVKSERYRDDRGQWPMVPLLLAKVTAISILVSLNEPSKLKGK